MNNENKNITSLLTLIVSLICLALLLVGVVFLININKAINTVSKNKINLETVIDKNINKIEKIISGEHDYLEIRFFDKRTIAPKNEDE